MKVLLLITGVIATFCVPTAPFLSLLVALPCLAGALFVQLTEEGRH